MFVLLSLVGLFLTAYRFTFTPIWSFNNDVDTFFRVWLRFLLFFAFAIAYIICARCNRRCVIVVVELKNAAIRQC